MARLRVVTPGDPPAEGSFAEAARAALERALAEGAVALVVIWETPGSFGWQAVPDSQALAEGLTRRIKREMVESDDD